MRIAFIIPSLSSKGPVNQAVSLALALMKNQKSIKISFYVLDLDTSSPNYERLIGNGVSISHLGGSLWSKAHAILGLVKSGRFDILHSHCLVPDFLSYITKKIQKNSRTLHISTCHCFLKTDYAYTYGKKRGLVLSCLHALLFKGLDKVVSCSSSVRKYLDQEHQIASYPVRNGSDVSHENIAKLENHESYKFVYVGPFIHRKNINKLLLEFSNRSFDNCSLELIGGGPLLSSLKKEYAFDPYITFSGNLSHIEVLEHISHSDCMVSFSSAEGFPMALLEGLSLGKPLLVSDIEPHRELLSLGNCGWLVSNEHNHFDMVLKSEEKLEISKSALTVYNRNLTSSIMAKGYFDIYSKELDK
ncbi:glycosyltransferase family 4 protein [Vibrio cyclitrophicus]